MQHGRGQGNDNEKCGQPCRTEEGLNANGYTKVLKQRARGSVEYVKYPQSGLWEEEGI